MIRGLGKCGCRTLAVVWMVSVAWSTLHPGRCVAQGLFWQPTSGPNGAGLNTLLALGRDTLFAATTGSGLYRTTNRGASWMPANNGLTNPYVSNLVRHPAGHLVAACYLYDTYQPGLFISYDSGEWWAPLPTGASVIVPVLGMRADGLLLVGGADTVLVSSDGGGTWSVSRHLFYGSVTAIEFDLQGVAYLGSVWGVWQSSDDGATWTQIGELSQSVNDVLPGESGVAIVTTMRHGVWKWTPPGPWSTHGLEGTSPGPLVRNTAGNVFVGRSQGRVHRWIGDTNWTSVGTGIPTDQVVRALAVDQDGYLFAGTYPGGVVYRSIGSTTSADPGAPGLPEVSRLEQNYPNPFNPMTQIPFEVASKGRVRLSVFDVLGREVAVLVDGEKEPGRYTAAWDASARSTGIYFATFSAGGRMFTTKMTLVR